MNDMIQYKDYYASVHFSTEDEVFYGKISGINDLVTFEGQSVKELKEAFREAIEDYLATCKELNKIPEKTYKGSFNVRISPTLHKEAAFVALKTNVTLNDFVKSAISYAIKHLDSIKSEIIAAH